MNEPSLTQIKKSVIKALFTDAVLSSRLVLKGGNLLDLIFEISSRSSLDVDFSISDEFESTAALQQSVSTALQTAFGPRGFTVFDVVVKERPKTVSKAMKDFWGGYRLYFKIIESSRFAEFRDDIESMRRNATVIGMNHQKRFQIDISRHEYCDEKVTTEIEGCRVVHYSAEMATFEKLRSICQQMPQYLEVVGGKPGGRARDFFDIYELAEAYQINFAAPENQELVSRIFQTKKVPLHLIASIGDTEVRAFHEQDFVAVRDTVKAGTRVRDFEFYVDYLVRRCRALESLWNK